MTVAPTTLPPDGDPLDKVLERLRGRDRATLARAITLIESRKEEHRAGAAALVQAALPYAGQARRIGITGAPGVGKSTLIDRLGRDLIATGHRVAVLAVDPSSTVSGGSILGDKTRMADLAGEVDAFIRPSPAGRTLGGVAGRTREAMLLCEAAGFDVVLVETVGTGQSETAVADMVDTFLVLVLPGAGDELQGLKKGVLELADVVAVTKADGGNASRAAGAAADCRAALRILAHPGGWRPPVLTVSALSGEGLDTLWQALKDHRTEMQASGAFEARRREQQVRWMWALLEERLLGLVRGDAELAARLPELEARVRDGALAPSAAVEEIAGLIGFREAGG